MRRRMTFYRILAGFLCFIVSLLYIADAKPASAATTTEPASEASLTGSEAGGELHAFYPAYTSFSAQLQKYIDDVDSVSFAWGMFEASSPGTLNTVKGLNGNYSFYYPKDYIQPVTYAKKQGKSIQLSLYMSGKGSTSSLPYKKTRRSMVQTITELMKKDITDGNGIYFDGVVIDFEGLRDTDSSKKPILYSGKTISTYFTDFLTELKAELSPLGKKLYVAVNVREYFDGFNYTDILKVADRVIIMAHSYDPGSSVKISKNHVLQYTGEKTTKVNSLAPIQKVQKALTDMQTSASDPADLKKVWLQICFDSAQWKFDVNSPEGWTKLSESALCKSKASPSYKSLKELVDNANGNAKKLTYGYNTVLQSPFIQYFNASEKTWNLIIYEDSNSIAAKIDLMNSFGMGGISVWCLSNVPDYNDDKGLAFHLNGWDTILSKMIPTPPSPEQPEDTSSTQFTDPGIEAAVRKKLGNKKGEITSEDLLKVKSLKLTGSISILNDLKMLKNLEYLDARNLGIKDISALSGLVKLDYLNLNHNKISDVSPLKNLKKLERLYLSDNNITSIKSLAGLTKLEILNLSGNKISDISALSKLKKLWYLDLDSNSIRDLKPLSGLPRLEELYLNKNSISSVTPLAKLTSLTVLELKDNKLTKIAPLKSLVNLETLMLKGNSIKDYTSIKVIYSKKGFVCDFNKK